MTVELLRARELMSERAWQDVVVDLARVCGWLPFHVLRPKGMEPGWPDLVLLRPPEIIFAELKRERGKVTAAQARVLGMLEACGLEVCVWRPSNFDQIHARLTPRGRS